ncbi:hypothetical protein B0H14DRAFT_2768018 [Mycena olivaceomarginata]|nr:hypothetical protein B0H14DRAFT_2768018 [Mycena olivaceomarginata]
MPARRGALRRHPLWLVGALARPGRGRGRRAAAGIALCCTCSPLPFPLPGNPSRQWVQNRGSNSHSSWPGDLLECFAPCVEFLVCLHVGVPQMGSGGAPRDVCSADILAPIQRETILELRRPCIQPRAHQEVVRAVLCAPALAPHRPRRHTPHAPKEIKPRAEVGV